MNVTVLKSALTTGKHLLSQAQDIRKGLDDLGIDWRQIDLSRFDPRGLDLDKLPLKSLSFASLMKLLPARTTLSVPMAAATFGAGFLSGAAAVALFTPKRGDELRAVIREQFQNAWVKTTGGDSGFDDIEKGDTPPKSYEEKLHRDDDRRIHFEGDGNHRPN